MGLEGLVGSLDSIIINTEQEKQKHVIQEIIGYTGFNFEMAIENKEKESLY